MEWEEFIQLSIVLIIMLGSMYILTNRVMRGRK